MRTNRVDAALTAHRKPGMERSIVMNAARARIPATASAARAEAG
jgi:hypothetical protein